jgi:CHAT domain-containing protein
MHKTDAIVSLWKLKSASFEALNKHFYTQNKHFGISRVSLLTDFN